MTDKELKGLKKSELLELLLYVRKELDEVKEENQRLTRALEYEKARKDDEMLQLLRNTSEKVDVFCEWLFSEEGKED